MSTVFKCKFSFDGLYTKGFYKNSKLVQKFRMRYSLYDSGYKKVWVSIKHELQATGGLTIKAKFYRSTVYIHHYYDYCFETL